MLTQHTTCLKVLTAPDGTQKRLVCNLTGDSDWQCVGRRTGDVGPSNNGLVALAMLVTGNKARSTLGAVVLTAWSCALTSLDGTENTGLAVPAGLRWPSPKH